ncbi:hypothetical protein C9J85_18805 [Haloferax sp. wsp5]|nr:hypothetical protein C9J85_18805 [Haloferax sp. wsp5]
MPDGTGNGWIVFCKQCAEASLLGWVQLRHVDVCPTDRVPDADCISCCSGGFEDTPAPLRGRRCLRRCDLLASLPDAPLTSSDLFAVCYVRAARRDSSGYAVATRSPSGFAWPRWLLGCR